MQNIENYYFFTIAIYWGSIRNICCYNICQFWWYHIHNKYNFITPDHWSISNTFWIFTILPNICAGIPTIVFFALTIIFIFTLTCFIILFLIWLTCSKFEFSLTITWNMFCHCFSLIFGCYHIKCFLFLLGYIFLEIRHYNFQCIYLN